MTDTGGEFQTDGAAHKRRFREVGASERLDEQWRSRRAYCSVRVLTRWLMRWLRYCGTDVFIHLVVYYSVLNRQPV